MITLIHELAEPSRRQILMELRTGPKTVSELVAATGMKQPNVSNHLAKLRAKEIVRPNKIGRQVYYALGGPTVEAAILQLYELQGETPAPKLKLDDISKQYARSAIAGDEANCAQLIDQLIRQGVPLDHIYQFVIAEAMYHLGRWYEVEAIDVGQEHIASAITERMMARVVHFAPSLRRGSQVAIVGCVEGNWHNIGPRMISDYLRLRGWKSVFLGASTPTQSFVSSVREYRPQLVLLSCAHSDARSETIRALDVLSKLREELGAKYLLGVGGRQALENPSEFLAHGADFSSASLLEFANEVLARIED